MTELNLSAGIVLIVLLTVIGIIITFYWALATLVNRSKEKKEVSKLENELKDSELINNYTDEYFSDIKENILRICDKTTTCLNEHLLDTSIKEVLKKDFISHYKNKNDYSFYPEFDDKELFIQEALKENIISFVGKSPELSAQQYGSDVVTRKVSIYKYNNSNYILINPEYSTLIKIPIEEINLITKFKKYYISAIIITNTQTIRGIKTYIHQNVEFVISQKTFDEIGNLLRQYTLNKLTKPKEN